MLVEVALDLSILYSGDEVTHLSLLMLHSRVDDEQGLVLVYCVFLYVEQVDAVQLGRRPAFRTAGLVGTTLFDET